MRAVRLALVAVLAALALPAPPVGGQQGSPIAVGDKVRARTSDQTVVGVVRRVGEGFLELEAEGDPGVLNLDLASVERLQVHRGTKGATLRGLFIGLALGTVIGAIDGSDESLCTSCSGSAAGVEAIALGLLGAGVGALIGSRVHVDRWETLALPDAYGGTPDRALVLQVGWSVPVGWGR